MARNAVGYQEDFFEWTREQARLLRSGDFSRLDAENLAEEIESVGQRDRREVADRIEDLLVGLLKWSAQPGHRCGNWRSGIKQQRQELERVLDDSPSLRQDLKKELPEIYSNARYRVAEQLGFLKSPFPEFCPFTPEQVLSEDFLPDG